MTAVNPLLAAAIAEQGIPLTADLAPSARVAETTARAERRMEKCRKRDRADLVDLEFMKNDVLNLAAELAAVRAELDRRTEHLAFLERNTLPELRRTIQHHEDGKKRWRDRAEKAEARVRELERPAVEAKRNEIRSSYVELISQAEQDRDHEGAAQVTQLLADAEAMWRRNDEEAAS
jgi:hypothetical protein